MMQKVNIGIVIFAILVTSIFPQQIKGNELGETIDVVKKYDVVVCGAEPEGIATAITASRAGLKTVLIDTRSKPGGLYTSGMLSMIDLNYNGTGGFVNEGVFREFYKGMGSRAGFDISHATQYFSSLLSKNGVEVLYNVNSISPTVTQAKAKSNSTATTTISYIDVDYGGRKVRLQANYYVDAMQDIPTARRAGVKYIYGREELGLKNTAACATLVFSVKGANWQKIKTHLKSDGNPSTSYNSTSAWGYPELRKYQPKTHADRLQLRGLNIAKEDNGSLVINAFQIFNVNALDEASKQEAYKMAKAELPYIIQYLNKKAPGFEHATLDKVADELYIREGALILGEERLTIEDAYQNRNYPNKIAYGSYPVDLQSTEQDGSGGNTLISRNLYTIPMGAVIPKDFTNLLIAGRSASYDILIHGSARTVPVGIALGQATAEMCYVAKSCGINFSEMYNNPTYYKKVQKRLLDSGVTLNAPLYPNNPEIKNWSYPYIQNLRAQGFLAKMYNGEKTYACNEEATFATFSNIVSLAYRNSNLPISVLGASTSYCSNKITKDSLVKICNKLLNTEYSTLEDLKTSRILDYTTYKSLASTETIYNSHAYAFMDCLFNYLRLTEPLAKLRDITRCDL